MVLRGEQIQRCGRVGCNLLSARTLSHNLAHLHPCRALRLTSTRLNGSPVSRGISTGISQETRRRLHGRRDPILHIITTLSPRWDVNSATVAGLDTSKADRRDTRRQQAPTCHSSSGSNPSNKEVQTLSTTHHKTLFQVNRVRRCVARLPREELSEAERRSLCLADTTPPTLS